MSPIPGEPLDPKPPELATKDGRRVRLKFPGLAPRPTDLIVKVLRFGPPSGEPPCILVRVGPLAAAAGGGVR